MNPRTLQRMARVLKPGGRFRFASDIETYVDWTLQHLRDHPAFAWEADGPATGTRLRRLAGHARYEAKAHREGRKGAYLTFRRL